MLYPVRSDRFGNLQVVLEVDGLNPSKILVNGMPAPQGKNKNQFIVKSEAGIETIIDLKATNIFDVVPTVELNGNPVRVVRPLAWYECVVIASPLILVGIGGAIGGMIGGAATALNRSVMRSGLDPTMRYVTSIGIAVISIITWTIVVSIIRSSMGV